MQNSKQNSIYSKIKHPKDILVYALIYSSAAITVFTLSTIILYILINGVPYISWSFLTTPYSETNKALQGILPIIINTLYVVIITLIISLPIGISSAIYLTQYAPKGPILDLVRFASDVLSGIPSIIYGLFGYVVFCNMFRLGASILAGSLTMAMCILPMIINTTEESLKAVPKSYSEAALALGSGRFKIIMRIILPCAIRGIITSVILSIGRIVGESAALLYTSGMAYNMPKNILSPIFSSGRTLTLHLYQISKQASTQNAYQIAFATASVLLILIFILNMLSNLISKKIRKI